MKVFNYPWRLFTRIDFHIGSPQVGLSFATASRDIRKYMNPAPRSTVGIMSYNFPVREWSDGNFLKWLKNLHKKGVKIKVVGGPKIQAQRNLEQLVKDGVIEVRLLEKPQTYHIIYATKPKQLWIETYHKSRRAHGCYFTKNPYPDTWKGYVKVFSELWKGGNKTKI